MQTTVVIVKPPFAFNINQFAFTFQEVSMVFILPRNSGWVVGKCPISAVPAGYLPAVAAEGAEIKNRNCTNWI